MCLWRGVRAAREQVAGFFTALAAVLVSTVRSSLESGSFRVSAAAPHDAAELPYRPDFFHCVFMLASAYLVRPVQRGS